MQRIKVACNEKDNGTYLRAPCDSILAFVLSRRPARPASNGRCHWVYAQQLLALLHLVYGSVVFVWRDLATLSQSIACFNGNCQQTDTRLYGDGRGFRLTCTQRPDSRILYSLWGLRPRTVFNHFANPRNGERITC